MVKSRKNSRTTKLKKWWNKFLTILGAISLSLGIVVAIIQIKDKLYTPKAILKYDIKCHLIINDDKIVYFENQKDIYSFQKKLWIDISDKYDSPENLDKLQYCELKLINIGDKELKMSDFYESDKPRIQFGNYVNVIGAYVKNKQTPPYTNFKITKMKDKLINFSFDIIEPNDKVILGILLNDDSEVLYGTNFLGRSKYFENIKPLNYETASLLGLYEEAKELNSSFLDDYFILVLLLLLIFIPLAIEADKKDRLKLIETFMTKGDDKEKAKK